MLPHKIEMSLSLSSLHPYTHLQACRHLPLKVRERAPPSVELGLETSRVSLAAVAVVVAVVAAVDEAYWRALPGLHSRAEEQGWWIGVPTPGWKTAAAPHQHATAALSECRQTRQCRRWTRRCPTLASRH